ncbi:MAG TPA: hypothetical protein VHO25_19330 [Polyangiaceae bacterium]|nr:hypothetical protein [Polyangiaceae bacterium]
MAAEPSKIVSGGGWHDGEDEKRPLSKRVGVMVGAVGLGLAGGAWFLVDSLSGQIASAALFVVCATLFVLSVHVGHVGQRAVRHDPRNLY